ncbi:MAG: 3-oxoacyl-ACP synthase [[Candidatus Thermochlorobacteriaceae] bacterium GBChlB]|jgi:3-oxoacyl-[acyl-carrier protein] reductase|nr:MAG: 3-oxoacyl-ACP synthase [[Candidatus Thermochlorobacteriaceae] bacterium GBChlB]
MSRLKNKVAVITGGAQGIGKATAEKFADEGASVALWDLSREKAEVVVKDLIAKNVTAAFFDTNVADYASVETAAKKTIERFGRIDILINNAGITRDATLMKMSPEQWKQVIDVNLTGVFNCTKIVAAFMAEKGYGRIINAASVVGIYGNFGQTNYVATKAGVIGMTRVWARELGKKGITVNVVAPGFIETEMIQSVPEKVLNSVTERTPLGRLGKTEDIANAYCFLASDDASFITGAVLSVDGGYIS